MSETTVRLWRREKFRKIAAFIAGIICFITPFFGVWTISGIINAVIMYTACIVTAAVIATIAHFVIDTDKE